MPRESRSYAALIPGDWLLKAEAAYFQGPEFLALPGERKSRLDRLLGVEYLGFLRRPIRWGVGNRHFFDFRDRLRDAPEDAHENDFESALWISRDSCMTGPL